MSIPSHLSKQDPARIKILSDLHQLIISADPKVTPEVGTMMRNEMIIYKCSGIFKYGLASGKNYMSLHLMPIYGSTKLHEKYKKLLSTAAFQKGCINFKSAEEMPLHIAQQLIEDCAKIDMLALMNEYKSRKVVKK